MSSLKDSGAATVDELREFLDGMRGKSAKEVLGKIAESGLIKAVVQATVASVVGIAVFTVGPYFLQAKKGTSASPSAEKAASEKTAENKPAAGDNATASAGSAADPKDAAASPSAATGNGDGTAAGAGGDVERAAKMMGVGDTKTADPKSNPRERDLDSLLDKIK
ncbi:MAG: hypothetical protein RLY70_3661 [Planctomycetota bacterium]|jgi:hypothetical protein